MQQHPPRSPRQPQHRGPAPRQQEARGSTRPSPLLMIGFGFIILAGIVIGGLAFLFVVAPTDLIRDRLVEEVRAQTGRTLVIGGPVSLEMFPSTGVTLSNVSLSSPAGFGGGPVVKARTVKVEVGLGSLLSRNPEVRNVVVTEPEFNLVVDRNGRRNWDFAALSEPVRYAQARGTTTRDVALVSRSTGTDIRPLLAALMEAGTVEGRIDGGRARYRDERTGETLFVEGINVTGAHSPGGAAGAKGRFSIRGQSLDVVARLDSPRALLSDGRAELTVKANGAPLNVSLDGTVRLSGRRTAFDGSLSLGSRSTTALAAMLGRPPASSSADFSLSSRVTYADDRISLVNFNGTLAGKSAQGSIVVDTREERPRVTGTVELAALDFGALLLRAPGDPGPAGVPPPAPATRPTDPIADLLRRDPAPRSATPGTPSARPRADTSREWSNERLDTHLLSLFDAELKISTAEILHHRLRTGPSLVAVNLVDRQLRIDLEDMTLYGGRGRGVAVVDASQAIPTLTLNLTLDGIQGGPFLEDAAGFAWLEGRANANVALAGQGGSERELVETLSGTIEVKSGGGALRGFDIPKIMRSIETGDIPSLGIQPNDRTAFTELGALFVVSNGVAQNKDLRLFTQNARLTGSGVVNIPAQHLDFELRAKLTGSGTRSEGTIINFSNIELPLRIEGPWDQPSLSLKGQDQIVDGIRQIGKNLRNPEVQDALKGLFGGGNSTMKPRDLLDKLLKKE